MSLLFRRNPSFVRAANGPHRTVSTAWIGILSALIVPLVALMLAGAPAAAQMMIPLASGGGAAEGAATSGETDILERAQAIARETGGTVLVVTPDGVAAPDATATQSSASPVEAFSTAVLVRKKIDEIYAAIPTMPGAIAAGLAGARPDGSLIWVPLAIILTGLAFAAGIFARRFFTQWARQGLARVTECDPRDRAERVSTFLVRTLLAWAGVVAFLVASFAVIVVAAGGTAPARVTATTVCSVAALWMWIDGLFRNLFSPDHAGRRMVPFSDALAGRFYRQIMTVLLISATAYAVCLWLANFAIPGVVHQFTLKFAAIVNAVLLSGFVIIHRRDVADAIRGEGRPRALRKLFASTWHILVVAYLVGATLVNISAIAMTGVQAGGTILGPTYALVTGFGIYAVLVIVIDRRFRTRQRELGASEGEIEAGVVASEAASTGDTVEIVGGDKDEVRRVAWAARWKALFEHFAAIVSVVAGAFVLLLNWSLIDLEPGGFVERFAGIAVVLLLAYIAYQSTKVWIDGKMEEEAGPVVADGESEDGMGPGASRLATLLPIMRMLLVVTIVSIAAMTVLAGLGVNIAPLFAGAGVVGLAVGFGAQTLIRDMFSGAFFLLDDAFRKGEFIEVGGIMGAVEKISLRSFQLRHQNGPLHTIPFGNITQLTNYSRDWVVMKLPLRLTYDTDVEKVRKLVKKLGQEMAADPDIGGMFLQPLKSQGVVQMDDSAMILRVKYMTKPGDQFITRRHVYQRIQQLFDENDIHFAHREVTVRIADENPPDDPEERRRRQEAAAGAVRPLLDQPAVAAAGDDR